MWLIAPEVAVTVSVYCPAGVPGSGVLIDVLPAEPPHPAMAKRKQAMAKKSPNCLVLRRRKKRNIRAKATELEPHQ